VKRISIVVGAVALLMAIPAAQAGARDASASGVPLVQIKGHDRLRAAKTIKFKIVCAKDCAVHVNTTLIIPGPNVHLDPAAATARANHPLVDTLTLLNKTPQFLKDNYRVSRLKVVVRARDVATSKVRFARKTFRFHL
jgi:hypothetical protein